MSHHYKNIGELIAHIEADAKLFEGVAEQKVADVTQRAALCSAANNRGYAAGLRTAAMLMRNAVIGDDLHAAKPLDECR